MQYIVIRVKFIHILNLNKFMDIYFLQQVDGIMLQPRTCLKILKVIIDI